ncbi:hypothetical protein BaRGS_00028842, partial [Batillaria attramentaria]
VSQPFLVSWPGFAGPWLRSEPNSVDAFPPALPPASRHRPSMEDPAVHVTASCACELSNTNNETKAKLVEYLADDSVRLVEYSIRIRGYSERFWRNKGGGEWFQPWRWYRAKGENSERLLLLFHYYYGLLKPYLGIGTETLDLDLDLDDPGCLRPLSSEDLEDKLRHFLYYDLKNETERLEAKFADQDIHVCSMHVGDYDGWGRLVYRCCHRDDEGNESCNNISDDEWVWVLRAFIITVSALLFLYFPTFIPKGYFVYTFFYYPPDGQSFTLIRTSDTSQYKSSPHTTVVPAGKLKKMRKFAAYVGLLQPDVVHTVKIKRACFECGMDRLLSETSSPVSAFRTIFDSLIRCKVRHADPLEDCCNSPLCGELFCTQCPAWHAWLRAVRTVLVLVLLALPAFPILYAMAGDDLEYQELARIFEDRGLKQSFNYYIGLVAGRVIVGTLCSLYVFHGVLVVVDGCTDGNLARAYTELLQVSRRKARLQDRVRQSQSIIKKAVWPIKRYGILAIPAGLILLGLVPIGWLVYVIFTSPVPKLIMHTFSLLCGNGTNRHRQTQDEMSKCRLVESVLFVVTLIAVFAVVTLSINFLVHVLVILLVTLIVDISFVMKFLPIVVLLLVYVRDSFKVVNNTYSAHYSIVLRHVLGMEAEDIKNEADKDWAMQENKIFKIVPDTAEGAFGCEGKDEKDFRKKKLFFRKNGAWRMRTRSLILFLDKDDIPYIPKKFLFHTTCMACPGSPGRIAEAFLKAAGRFGRTVVFLLFIMLVVLAYADTYYISPTSQFFAILLTGTIPLVLRYFFLNPGSVTKVDTTTLRFRTQMDDKIESFMQSWVLEDLEVAETFLCEDYDNLYNKTGPYDVDFTPPDKDTVQAMMTQDGEDSPAPLPANGRPGSKRLPPLQRPQMPLQKREYGLSEAGVRTTPGGYGNFMLADDSPMDGDADDWSHYQTFTDPTLEQDAGLPPAHRHSRQQPKKQNSSANHHPNAAKPAERPQRNGSVRFGAGGLVANNIKSLTNGDPKAGKTGTDQPPRIDLVVDISGEEALAVYSVDLAEKAVGIGRPPNLHWKRKSNLVRDSTEKSEGIGETEA